jgi:hypothetical protein
MTDIQDINSPGRPSGRRRSDRVVGASRAMQGAVEQAALAARSDATVIVGGPPGSGRGHLARAIHAWSNRAGRKLTAFSAAATPEEEQQREGAAVEEQRPEPALGAFAYALGLVELDGDVCGGAHGAGRTMGEGGSQPPGAQGGPALLPVPADDLEVTH